MDIKKMLVIVPHPDDEINIAAQLILEMNKVNVATYVVYTTNGDSEKKIGNKRIKQAIEALKLIKVKKSHIIFLGYANDWKDGHHIYMAEDDEIAVSGLGKKETNSITEHPEYCMKKCGVHHSFTKSNYKNDLKNVLYDIMPDLIVCVDFDRHPDHRATSLAFEEAMGKLLKEKKGYYPVVLKRFAYNGVWFGEKDYYSSPFQRTKKSEDFIYSGGKHELESPCFRWNERISFEVDESTKTKFLHKNILYKMAKKHYSTIAWYQMQRVINDDITYWYRPTKNYMHGAAISATSGNIYYLNDYILYGCRDIMNDSEPFINADNLWIPDDDDVKKEIIVSFKTPKEVKFINIYEDCSFKNHIESLKIVINHSDEFFVEPDISGAVTQLVLANTLKADNIEFFVESYTGTPGIAEIEILPEDAYQYNLPLKVYSKNRENAKNQFNKLPVGVKIEKIYMNFLFLILFKIGYETKKRVIRK